ncbi:MAG TPA: hypothetical protein VGH32_10635, partial [Pirellulales bacterium]
MNSVLLSADAMNSAGDLRLVMMGTGPFAVPTFVALLRSPHRVLALVTRPDRPVHDRKRDAASQNPMREAAERAGIEV